MAKGSGSDYEDMEDEENINENYREAAEEFTESAVDGDNEGNYNEYPEQADEEYPAGLNRGDADFR